MRYYLDTEFIEDGRTIDLLSIGVVCEDGREFYAEVEPSEVDWAKANPWVLENVIPHLYGPEGGQTLPKAEIATELLDFIRHYANPPEFWGYYSDYDWVVICQLYGTMMDLPEGWPMHCMDLKQWAVQLGDPELPEQLTVEHHALADAWHNHDVHAMLLRYQSEAQAST